MILLIDNYDSFTYNLYQYLSELGATVRVRRNDEISAPEILKRPPQQIVLSPGPGRPEDAGACLDIIRACASSIPILGVCLGHQAIAQAFGGKVLRARRIMHGKSSRIHHDGKGLYRGLPKSLDVVRYHSLIVDKKTLPRELKTTARTSDGLIMGIRHARYAVEGVQFHPESFMSDAGKGLLRNFISLKNPHKRRSR